MMQRTRPHLDAPAGIRGIRERATRPPGGRTAPRGGTGTQHRFCIPHDRSGGNAATRNDAIPTATVPAEQPTSGDTRMRRRF
ncbi:hypothetical protein QJS66_12170 [Kocuria rhizophila]|nr:hypothetical protein QJS66_12170 [Kocuria rhizophila]